MLILCQRSKVKKQVAKILETTVSNDSYQKMFYEISRRKGIDVKAIIALMAVVLEEIEVLQEQVKYLKNDKDK